VSPYSAPGSSIGTTYVCLISLLVGLEATEVAAWNYKEHVEITRDAFLAACDAIRTEEAERGKPRMASALYCSDDLALRTEVATCLGQMAAIAGDYQESPEDLVASADQGYLRGKSLRCDKMKSLLDFGRERSRGNVVSAPTGEIETMYPWYGRLRWLRLLVNNSQHFQPDSATEWRRLHEEALELAQSGASEELVLSKLAFALHFLEDSFAAGHNGLDRTGRAHEYSQAYHDDFNNTGVFLIDATGREWHSYGDSRKNDDSIYILPPHDWSDPSWRGHIDALLADLNGPPLSDFLLEELEAIQDSGPQAGWHVLSIQLPSDSLFDYCFYMDNCNKIELVVAPSAEHFGTVDDDDELHCSQRNFGTLKTFHCPSSRHYVAKQAERALKSFLRVMSGGLVATQDLDGLESHFPARYRTIESTAKDYGGINKGHFLLRYGEPQDVSTMDDLGFTGWGFSLQGIVDGEVSDGLSLGWAIKGGLSPRLPRARLLLRWDLVDEEGSLLSGADAAVYWDVDRVFKRLVGVSLKGSVGVDGAWQGPGRRNLYGGYGASLDVHFGKQVVHLDFDHLTHWSENLPRRNSIRILVGLQAASIDLRPRAQ
jgi:hypothetical protein